MAKGIGGREAQDEVPAQRLTPLERGVETGSRHAAQIDRAPHEKVVGHAHDLVIHTRGIGVDREFPQSDGIVGATAQLQGQSGGSLPGEFGTQTGVAQMPVVGLGEGGQAEQLLRRSPQRKGRAGAFHGPPHGRQGRRQAAVQAPLSGGGLLDAEVGEAAQREREGPPAEKAAAQREALQECVAAHPPGIGEVGSENIVTVVHRQGALHTAAGQGGAGRGVGLPLTVVLAQRAAGILGAQVGVAALLPGVARAGHQGHAARLLPPHRLGRGLALGQALGGAGGVERHLSGQPAVALVVDQFRVPLSAGQFHQMVGLRAAGLHAAAVAAFAGDETDIAQGVGIVVGAVEKAAVQPYGAAPAERQHGTERGADHAERALLEAGLHAAHAGPRQARGEGHVGGRQQAGRHQQACLAAVAEAHGGQGGYGGQPAEVHLAAVAGRQGQAVIAHGRVGGAERTHADGLEPAGAAVVAHKGAGHPAQRIGHGGGAAQGQRGTVEAQRRYGSGEARRGTGSHDGSLGERVVGQGTPGTGNGGQPAGHSHRKPYRQAPPGGRKGAAKGLFQHCLY